MKQIDSIHGNKKADHKLSARVAEHDAQGTLETVEIAAGERKKSRLRVETDAGTDLGLVLDRPLRAGDVLAVDEERAIIVKFEDREAAVIELPEPTAESLAACTELGHRVGNQHWDLAVQDGTIYIPVAADRHIIEDVLADSLPAGCSIRYELVSAALWIDEEPGDDGGHDDSHGSHADHGHGDHDHSETAHGHSHAGEQS